MTGDFPERRPRAFVFGPFTLVPERQLLLRGDTPLLVGGRALDILTALVERPGEVVSKRELMARVWPTTIVDEGNLKVNVAALRRVLRDGEADDAMYIATVTGRGYRLVTSVQAGDSHGTMWASPAAPHNLPQPLTSFIGRDQEIAEIRQWLTSTRLVTLTGAGGCGKTRLALQVAGGLIDAYPGGVRLVELAPLGDQTLVAQAVAKALAIETLPGRDILETIVDWLSPRRVLLVVDNAEHLLDACARLVDTLLRRCANVVVVATSRERLGIDGELNYRVPSLSVPASEDVEGILACEAARLFMDRARLQRQDFEPSGKDTAALASICQRLDGIALAIELAASQVRVMSLEELNTRLDSRFAVLTGGSRTALPRHRTLRSLIDWSHDLLSEPEQIVMRRVSVFAGGWSLEGAERICSGNGVQLGDVLGLLSSLVDKNLVVAETRGENARFGMLETVRDYARGRLRDSGEATAMHERLTEFLIDIGAGLDAAQDTVLQNTLRQLDAEHDNLRVALGWCESDPARALHGLRLAALLMSFWLYRGHYGEGLTWLARLQAVVPAGERGAVQAMTLHASGMLLGVDSDQAAAAACLREAVDLWRQLGDRRQAARSLVSLAAFEWYGGNAASAREACETALPIAREFGDLRNVAEALSFLAEMARVAGDYDAAQDLVDECLTVSRANGGWSTAHALHCLGVLEYSLGNYARARWTLCQSLPGYREFGDRAGTAAALMHIAIYSQLLGEIPAATSQLREAWGWLPGGNDNDLLWWLDVFAGLLVDHDRAADAVRVWGCVARHREERGLVRPDPKRYLRQLDSARSALQDEATFSRAWSEGRSWPLDEARRFARDFYDALPDESRG